MVVFYSQSPENAELGKENMLKVCGIYKNTEHENRKPREKEPKPWQ